jgi:predicted DNA-binding transcriptional regulator AlpA
VEAGRVFLAGEAASLFSLALLYRIYCTAGQVSRNSCTGTPRMADVDERSRQDSSKLIQRALEAGPFSIQQLADEAGISYDSLYSWAKRRRVPRPENLRQLAVGFDRRAEVLRDIAEELRRTADAESTE